MTPIDLSWQLPHPRRLERRRDGHCQADWGADLFQDHPLCRVTNIGGQYS
jgi:hypothetical protein